MTLQHHDLDIFPVTLHAAYSREDWDHLRERIDSLAEDPGAKGHTSRDGVINDRGFEDAHVSIYVEPGQPERDAYRTIVHEAVHAALFVLEMIGEPLRHDTETIAYLADWIAAWVRDGQREGEQPLTAVNTVG